MAKAKKKDDTVQVNNDSKKPEFSFVAYPRPKMPNTPVIINGREKMYNAGDAINATLDTLTKLPAQTKRLLRTLHPFIIKHGLKCLLGDRYGFQVIIKDKGNKTIMFSQDMLGFQNNAFFSMGKLEGLLPKDAFKKTWAGMPPTSYNKDLLGKLESFLSESMA